MLTSHSFDRVLRDSGFQKQLCVAFIDECDLVEEQGSGFRPCYKSIGDLRARLPTSAPWVAVSATLPKETFDHVMGHLALTMVDTSASHSLLTTQTSVTSHSSNHIPPLVPHSLTLPGLSLQPSHQLMISQKLSSSARPLPLAPAFTSSFSNSSLTPSPQTRLSLCTTHSYPTMAGHMPWKDSEQEPPGSLLPVTVLHGVLMFQTSGMLFYLAYPLHFPSLSNRLAGLDVTRNRRTQSHMLHHGSRISLTIQREEPNGRLPNSNAATTCVQCYAAGLTQLRPAVLETSSASVLTTNHPTLKTAVLYILKTSQPWNLTNPGFQLSPHSTPDTHLFILMEPTPHSARKRQ
jgi:hypothetical protein